MISGYPISTGFRKLMGYQRDPQNRGVTVILENYLVIIEILKSNYY